MAVNPQDLELARELLHRGNVSGVGEEIEIVGAPSFARALAVRGIGRKAMGLVRRAAARPVTVNTAQARELAACRAQAKKLSTEVATAKARAKRLETQLAAAKARTAAFQQSAASVPQDGGDEDPPEAFEEAPEEMEDGMNDEMGAPVNTRSNARAKAMAVRLARQMVARRGGAPVAVERKGPANIKTAFLKFVRDANNDGTIPAGSTVEIRSQPQYPFKPLGLIIDDASAEDFVIEDIKIGTDTLMADGGPIPATQFKGDALLNRMFQRTGQTSQKFTLRVKNVSGSARPFYGNMVGLGRRG